VLCCAAQAKEKARLKVGPKPLMQRLRESFRGFMQHFHKVRLCVLDLHAVANSTFVHVLQQTL
jgi:hypothetical protein